MENADADGDQVIGEIVIGIVQGGVRFPRPQKQHRGSGAVAAKATEIFGPAHRQIAGVMGDVQCVQRPGQMGGGIGMKLRPPL